MLNLTLYGNGVQYVPSQNSDRSFSQRGSRWESQDSRDLGVGRDRESDHRGENECYKDENHRAKM